MESLWLLLALFWRVIKRVLRLLESRIIGLIKGDVFGAFAATIFSFICLYGCAKTDGVF